MHNGIFAIFKTSKGVIKIKLTYDKTPGTVGNFIGLVEGNLKNDVNDTGTPYYDGLKFHRVIPDFMIQEAVPKAMGLADLDIILTMSFTPN